MDLFDVYRREKSNRVLSQVDRSFYKQVADQIKKYHKLLEISKEDLEESIRLKNEILNLRGMTKEIFFLRLEKIINSIILEVNNNIEILDDENLTFEESKLVEVLRVMLKSYKECVLDNISKGEYSDINKVFLEVSKVLNKRTISSDKVLILFKENFSQLIAPDSKTYGPFFKGDIVFLSKDIAEKLTNLNVCEKVEE